jgi:6-phosphofructokinase 1
MGRNSGYLASVAAIASGAEFALVPEREFDLSEICQQLRQRYEEGRDNAIIILAEGVAKGEDIADSIKDAIGFETRVTVLGHYQRGGAPTVFDRLLASRFGKKAVELLISGNHGMMVGLSCNTILASPLDDVIKGAKRPQDEMLRLAEVLGI